ncbi:RNA transcription, translation and transport factor protein-like [Biomphalaria glabrata]|uniref:RNA transcription, translation and transport factor protein-like n=1 Tax=Biomphalaria glabrata TaxID=6526 RepID=A0A9U8EBN7_BIOGL|nr:RNA transcription, translation and transport factor protein-like [Biomphalaria glabrata]
MFKRKLLALECSEVDRFDINDEGRFRALVLWLEDQKIRHLKIEDREPLRNLASNEWNKAFQSYLTEINSPHDGSDRKALLDWLLGYAIRLEYGDQVDKYKSATPESFKERKEQQLSKSINPLDNLDFNSPEFKAGITSLAMMLQIPPHSNHLEMLKAICIVIKEKFTQEAIDSAGKTKEKDEHIPLDKTELGFEAGDYIITEAAKILRLLHLRDLRDLQTHINQAIVAVQAITANPKTDSRLGKVGF